MLYMIDKIKQLLYVGKNLSNKRICMFKNSRGKKQGNNTTWQEREKERGRKSRKSRRQAKKIQAGSDIHDHGLHERIIRWIGAGLVTRVSNFD